MNSRQITATRSARPAFPPRPSAWAPGRLAAGCGAAPTRRESIAAIEASIDAGLTPDRHSAGLWPWPQPRRSSARRIKGKRDKAVIATKCGLNWHTRQGQPFLRPGRQAGASLSRPPTRSAYEVEQSLRRLGTDYIDLYITHWQDPTTPIAETMAGTGRPQGSGQDPGHRRQQCQRRRPQRLYRRRRARCDPGALFA